MAASQVAYAYAKERILDGRFAGGELISEQDVAAPTGLSRTPVREAFLQLESEGLLKLYPKRGALVVPVSALEVESVMETRLLVERFAIERAVERRADLAADLAEAIAGQEKLAAAEDPVRFVEADREFHRIFMAAAGNPILLELLDSLRDRQRRMGVAAIVREAGRMETIIAEHRELVDAVVKGDQALGADVLKRHLDGTLQVLRRSAYDVASGPSKGSKAVKA
jgi:DNA-binding GntR family transcriptional regulator